MSIRNKLVSVALTATTLVWSSGALLLVPVASAQSTSDLQAQIAALLAQIQQLQSKLNTTSGSSSSYSYTRDLTVGSKGADVTALQGTLISGGYLKASATGYFGSLTKAAVAAWQKAVGLSPAAGYFGPKSRAYLAGSMSQGGTPSGGGTPSPNAPASGLAVALSSDANYPNPPAGSLISSSASASARVPVLRLALTAGNSGPVTVSEIKLHKVGALSDSSISGAYLTQSGRVVSQYNSISNGVVDFAGLNLTIPAGQTSIYGFAVDPATGLNAGNTVSFSLNTASDITSSDASGNAITETGAFPFQGNTFTVTTVSNPSIATLTVASSSIGTNVTAGTTNNLVGAWNFTVQNSKSWLKSLNFKVIGSATKTDIKNVKLMVNGTQAGNTLASVDAGGNAYFDTGANPAVLNTGSNNIQIFADVLGSPSFNFQFEILNSYDLYVWDSQYNVPISGGSNVGTQVSIANGTITVSQAGSTPTGNIAPNQTGVILAQFTVYAGGEAVKIKWLGVGLTFVSASGTIDQQFKNLSLTDDAGGQVGTTINTLSTSVTCTDTAYSNSTTTYTNCYGNSSSPINYIVPANTTRILSLKGDVQSAASFTSVTGKLVGNTSNLQGLTSSATASSGATNGSALSLATASLTVSQNTGLGQQNLSAGSVGVRIGSYAFTASTAEGVTVNNISVSARGNMWSNLYVQVNGSMFGTKQGTVSSGTIYSFTGSPFTVPKGGTTYVDLYADSLSSATGSLTPASALTGCAASGAVSLAAISCSTTNGQNLTFAGQSTLTVTADSSQAPVGQIVMGTSQASLATFRFTETSNVENVKVTTLNVFDNTTNTSTIKAAFSNLNLYCGAVVLSSSCTSVGALLGTAGSAVGSRQNGYLYTFNFATPFVVPQANSVSLTLKGDTGSYSSSGATDNSAHAFQIATTTDVGNTTTQLAVVALGNTSNATSAVTITGGTNFSSSSAAGNTQTVLRSKLTFSATPLGAVTGRGKISSDQLATITFSAPIAGTVAINSITVTFSGTAPSITTFLDGVKLLDENNVSLGTTNTTSTNPCNAVSSTTCTKTFNLGSTTGGQQVTAGGSRTWTLVVDSTKTQAVTGSNNVNLVAVINANTDITYTDGLDSAATTALSPPSSILTPINLNSVTYAAGT